MKAKVFELKNGQFEMLTEENKKHLSEAGESYEDFTERLGAMYRDDYFEALTVVFVTEKKLKKVATKGLVKKLVSAKEREAKMILEILEKRGVETIKHEEKPEESLDDLNASILEELDAVPVAKKKRNPPKKIRTDSERVDLLATTKIHLGKSCTFLPFRADETIEGEIKHLTADKRTNRVYFKIEDASGKSYCCPVDSENLKVL